MLGLNTDPFPDLSKLVATCRRIDFESDPQARSPDFDKVPMRSTIVTDVAQALGLEI